MSYVQQIIQQVDLWMPLTTFIFMCITKPWYFPEKRKTNCMGKDNTK